MIKICSQATDRMKMNMLLRLLFSSYYLELASNRSLDYKFVHTLPILEVWWSENAITD